jgi:DNA processing protein
LNPSEPTPVELQIAVETTSGESTVAENSKPAPTAATGMAAGKDQVTGNDQVTGEIDASLAATTTTRATEIPSAPADAQQRDDYHNRPGAQASDINTPRVDRVTVASVQTATTPTYPEMAAQATPTPVDLATLRLSLVPGIGPRHYMALLDAFGSPSAVLAADSRQLQAVEGIGLTLSRAIIMAADHLSLDPLLRTCREQNIVWQTQQSNHYPELLKQIGDPPLVLYQHGQFVPEDALAIAIVGSRHATSYGLKQAEKLARGLALAGFTIVSGLARGIDQAAHRGALEAGGRTIAVLGSGLLNIYPPEHTDLAKQIRNQGVVVSEFGPVHEPKSGSFPQRNRIISGLSLGVVVVEAAQRSGALISARLAMEQNREVYAVPGRVDSRMSQGCHRLIRDGAKLVETVEDILEELGPLAVPIRRSDQQVVRNPAELKLNPQEMAVLQVIGAEPTEMDDIVAKSGLPINRVLSTISVLQMRKLIRRLSGSSVVRV